VLVNRMAVSAAAGGTVTAPGGEVKLVIPASALSADTTVTIQRVDGATPALGATMTAAGAAYAVSFDNGATLSEPMRIEVASAAAPAHPQIRELVSLVGGSWQRTGGNFMRSSDGKVIALTRTATTVSAVNRTLQATSGEGVARGRDVFLNETFGNQAFFGGTIGLHTLLNGLTPAQAVGAGTQVDLAKVPAGIAAVLTGTDLPAKDAALQNPAVTRALLKADAVVGVRAFYADPASDVATSAGITCALCHVAVTPTTFQLTSGATPLPIGPLRLDGAPNGAMNAGAILSLTPFAQGSAPTVALLQSWGPGRFDVRALPDNPLDDGVNNPTKVPQLWNFVDLAQQDYLYNWDGLFKNATSPGNALASQAEAVYDLVMHANGAFGTATGSIPPELRAAPPQTLLDALAAAEAGAPGNDVTAQKLLDVQDWQRSIVSPAPGAFDEALAEQGFLLFNGKASCSGCHRSAEFTGPVVTARITLAAPQGGLAGGIKTPGLRGLSRHAPYFHDGSAPTLRDVLDVYSGRITPVLTDAEKDAVVEYLKTL
jgi:cytochrome c peroxidase